MVVLDCPKNKSLSELAPLIDFFPTKVMCAVCRISLSTLERYRNDLLELKVPKFEWYFYSTGFDRTSAEIIYQYSPTGKNAAKGKDERLNHTTHGGFLA
jgi:hypothetical protein